MRVLQSRLKPLPILLRWVLAIVLILNGTFAPPVLTHAAMNQGHGIISQVMPTHCHHHDALPSSESAKHQQNPCPCCADGGACHCGCVVTLALPITVLDLRPLAPQMFADLLRAPEPAVAPLHRLLRPPIV